MAHVDCQLANCTSANCQLLQPFQLEHGQGSVLQEGRMATQDPEDSRMGHGVRPCMVVQVKQGLQGLGSLGQLRKRAVNAAVGSRGTMSVHLQAGVSCG